jgi:D-alanine-D-alanine ligase
MAFKIKEKIRVVVLVDKGLVPPKSIEGLSEKQIQPIRNEFDVISNMQKMGHDVIVVEVRDDLGTIRAAMEEHKPQIVFNLLVEFHGYTLFEPHVVSFLEMIKQPYTGCNPRGLMLSHDKALTKKILAFHRIKVPEFAVFQVDRKVIRPRQLKFPLLVKSLTEDGSIAISQASIVNDDGSLEERVRYIHKITKMHAIVEQYVEGREIYAAVIGNQRLRTFTPWELILQNRPPGMPNIASSKIKWNKAYQEKVGLITKAAELTPELRKTMDHISKRIFRLLSLSGYARLDFRLSPEGHFYLLEANPNPDISSNEDFAEAAKHCGVSYQALLQKILTLGLSYRPTI